MNNIDRLILLALIGTGTVCLVCSCSVTPGDAARLGGHFAQAAALYEVGANRGDALAANKLGDLYYHRPGLPEDHQKALYWYEKAVSLGNIVPICWIGAIYRDGTNNVPRDIPKARLWFERGAERGQHYSMYDLAELHASGAIQPSDDVRGLMWLEAVSELACAFLPQNEGTQYILRDPKSVRSRLEGRMSQSDIARAQKMAHDWVGLARKSGHQFRRL